MIYKTVGGATEEIHMHHDLDINPIPEKILYINELGIADTAFYYEGATWGQVLESWDKSSVKRV